VSVGPVGRDGDEIEAILVDRYLDSLLARRPADPDGVAAGLRAVAQRLTEDLPRYHPSFRFEERLAERLAEVAAGLRLPLAAGAEGLVVPFRTPTAPLDSLRPTEPDGRPLGTRPVVLGGVLTSAAISIAGAAFVAWRLRRPVPPMTRAARALTRARIS